MSRHPNLLRLVGLVVSLVALWLAARSVDLAAVWNQLTRASILPLVAVLAVIAAQVSLRSYRWRILLGAMPGGRQVAARRLVPPLLIGYLGNTVLPARLGEPIRAYLVARREALPAAATFGTAVLERVLDTATLGMVGFAAALLSGVPGWIVEVSAAAAILGAVAVCLLAAGGLFAQRGAGSRISRLVPRRLSGLARLIAGVLSGGGRVGPSAMAAAAAISAVCWLGDMTTFWLVARSLGIQLAPGAALLVAAVAVLGTALPSAPGYLGTFELAASTTASVFGVPASSALALAVLAHAMTLLPIAIAGALAAAATGSGLGSLSREAAASRPAAAPWPARAGERAP